MEERKYSGVCIAAFVCALVSIFINPVYLVSVAAIILGIIGLSKHLYPKGFALTGVIVGSITLLTCVVDVILSIVTFGMYLPFIFI